MQATLLVFLGAGIGGALRHGVNVASVRLWGVTFPWGTLVINLLGSLCMGLVVGWFAARSGGQLLRLFVATGVLGGFTTFSTFSLDVWVLWERGAALAALAYVGASVILGIAALALGLSIMRIVA